MKTQPTYRNTFNTERAPEITAWLIALLIMFLIFLGSGAAAMTPDFEEEAYIDDIPFSTTEVVMSLSASTIDFAEEAYIDDIPFITSKVVSDMDGMKNYSFETEAYIDDIPFSTAKVVNEYEYLLAVAEVMDMEEENYIEDIPFSTCVVANASMDISAEEFYTCSK